MAYIRQTLVYNNVLPAPSAVQKTHLKAVPYLLFDKDRYRLNPTLAVRHRVPAVKSFSGDDSAPEFK